MALQQRLDRLEREVRVLSQSTSAAGSGVAGDRTPAAAQIQVRLNALEGEVRAATGSVEKLAFEVRQIRERLDTMAGDLELRLQALEQKAAPSGETPATGSRLVIPPVRSSAPPTGEAGAATAPATAPPQGVLGTLPRASVPTSPSPPVAAIPRSPSGGGSAPGGGPVLPEGTVKEQYGHAFALLQKGAYGESEAAFAEFLRRHPSDPLADNARYWLAESRYGRGDFVDAADGFLAAYRANKQGPKAGDALLKLGMSLARLNKKQEACSTFNELKRTFPDANLTVRQRGADEERRIGCR
jgi:tol-pal system protein YbgF